MIIKFGAGHQLGDHQACYDLARTKTHLIHETQQSPGHLTKLNMAKFTASKSNLEVENQQGNMF